MADKNKENEKQGATNQQPPQEPQSTDKPEMISVPKDQLEKLMNLVPAVEQLQKDNEALLAVADRAKLQIFNERQQAPGNKIVKLLTYMDEERNRKVILAWSKIKDEVYKAPNGAWVEDQIMEVIFEDDTKKQLPLLMFYRSTADKIKAEVLEDKGDSFKVKTAEGKEYLIGKMFVN
jgi:hypothetical protein